MSSRSHTHRINRGVLRRPRFLGVARPVAVVLVLVPLGWTYWNGLRPVQIVAAIGISGLSLTLAAFVSRDDEREPFYLFRSIKLDARWQLPFGLVHSRPLEAPKNRREK